MADGSGARTSRAAAKAVRRGELLQASAKLMAARGFHAVRLEDVGAAVGISGPAVYRHFDGKEALLRALLEDISQRLYEGAVAATDLGLPPEETLDRLIAFHTDFTLTEPDLIRVQDRDLPTLSLEARRGVRTLQRRYVEIWVDTLCAVAPAVGETEARVRVHAVFGLLNSTPYFLLRTGEVDTRAVLTTMAEAALLA